MARIKEHHLFDIVFYICLLVGVAVLCGGVYFAVHYGATSKNYVATTAMVDEVVVDYIDGKRDYTVYVNFDFDGTPYTHIELGYYEHDMQKGDTLTIYCNRTNPTDIIMKISTIIVPTIFFVVGGIFTTVGIVFVVLKIKKVRKINRLKKSGTKLQCTIIDYKIDKSYTFNGRYVNVVALCAPQNSKSPIYESASFNQKYKVELNTPIDVYVNNLDQSKYYVDLKSVGD